MDINSLYYYSHAKQKNAYREHYNTIRYNIFSTTWHSIFPLAHLCESVRWKMDNIFLIVMLSLLQWKKHGLSQLGANFDVLSMQTLFHHGDNIEKWCIIVENFLYQTILLCFLYRWKSSCQLEKEITFRVLFTPTHARAHTQSTTKNRKQKTAVPPTIRSLDHKSWAWYIYRAKTSLPLIYNTSPVAYNTSYSYWFSITL